MEERVMEEEPIGEGMHSEFHEKELEVSEILLNLGELIQDSDSRLLQKPKEFELRDREPPRLPPFTVQWGTRKKRKSGKTSASSRIPTTPPPATAAPSQQVKVATVTSPASPLDFSLGCESDDNSSYPSQHKTSHKRKKDDLVEAMTGLSECRELLRKELESVTSYYNKLLAFNVELKTRKQMGLSASNSHKAEEEEEEEEEKPNNRKAEEKPNIMEINNNFGVISGQLYPTAFIFPHPNQLMVDLSVQGKDFQSPNVVSTFSEVRPPLFSPSTGLCEANYVGTLNSNNKNDVAPRQKLVGLTFWQSMDYAGAGARDESRAKAAEARRYRKMVISQQRYGSRSRTPPLKR